MITGVIATMQYYTEPLVAGQVASGQIGGSGQQVEPGYPDGSTLTLPQLVYNLGFQRFDIGAACVVAIVLFVLVDDLRRAPDASAAASSWGATT